MRESRQGAQSLPRDYEDRGIIRFPREQPSFSRSRLATLPGALVTPSNLPARLTSFIGRRDEMVEVKRLLVQTRLLTLTGAGGVGKTRLAQEVAGDLLGEYPDGICHVELAPPMDPTLVPHRVATALSVPEQPGRHPEELLTSAIGQRRLLLLLDNCEHLALACARLAENLLTACPQLRILATSREPLGAPGERNWRVPSLSFPEAARQRSVDLTEYEAVALFVVRTAESGSSLALNDQNAPFVAEVCRRLDGIPLAIELAAARMKVLSVEQIAERLEDRFRLLRSGLPTALPRHQTLRALVDWSYSLLTEDERCLLRRLAVFAGGFSLESAEHICAGGALAETDILDRLSQLVSKSLVLVEDEPSGKKRYRMLETIRQYAGEKLAEAEEDEDLRNRHLEWFARLAENGEQRFWSAESTAWLDELETEHANIRTALQWSRTAAGAADMGLRLGGSLWRFWDMRSHLSEAVELLEGLITMAPGQNQASMRAVFALGRARYEQGDLSGSLERILEAERLSESLGDGFTHVFAVFMQAQIAIDQQDLQVGRALADKTLELALGLDDSFLISMARGWIGFGALHGGEYETAATLFDASLAGLRKQGEPYMLASILALRGYTAACLGDVKTAKALIREGLVLAAGARHPYVTLSCFEHLTWTTVAEGRLARAARLLGALEGIVSRSSMAIPTPYKAGNLKRATTMRSELGDHAFAAAWAEGNGMPLDQAIVFALSDEDRVTGDLTASRDAFPFTQRECEVVALLARGCSNRQIADELTVTQRTAETHVAHILRKLSLESRAQVAAWAAEHGPLPTSDSS